MANVPGAGAQGKFKVIQGAGGATGSGFRVKVGGQRRKPTKVGKTPGLKRLLQARATDWLITEIDYFLERHQDRHRPDPGWFHPSSLGTLCDRCLALEYLGMRPPLVFSPQTIRRMNNGTYFHRRMTELFRRMGILVAHDLRVEIPEHCIRGSLDAIVRSTVGEDWVVELKSMNTREFRGLKAPRKDHEIQLLCYMVGADNHNGLMLIEDKDSQELKALVVPFRKRVWKRLTDRLLKIRRMIEAEELPQPYRASCECAQIGVEVFDVERG